MQYKDIVIELTTKSGVYVQSWKKVPEREVSYTTDIHKASSFKFRPYSDYHLDNALTEVRACLKEWDTGTQLMIRETEVYMA